MTKPSFGANIQTVVTVWSCSI